MSEPVARHAETITGLIAQGARTWPDAVALSGLTGTSLTYTDLLEDVQTGSRLLSDHGLKPGDRMAIYVPNGPDLARALLVAMSVGVAAPLNPAYGERDLKYYLEDLSPDLLIIDDRSSACVHTVAAGLGVPMLSMRELLHRELAGEGPTDTPDRAVGDTALILHTSGTTSRPKLVPLTHTNLCYSARRVIQVFGLDTEDRCLGLMPLFHIHGIVATMLVSLASGGTLICVPKLDADRVVEWLERLRPTWYTGVPTMHQAILSAVDTSAKVSHSLRFIRSCSSPLPPSVMYKLEDVFDVPVAESYGMTEAAHLITSNLLPPDTRKAGSVGSSIGPEVCVLDSEGRELASGKKGEVAVRGLNVMGGYLDNPTANAESFTNGWFRTGDEGYFDEDGALVLSGRIKEIVNRGGEKIAPREIDEALLEHSAVSQALAFGVPHPSLGEDLVAAVVCQPGSSVSEGVLRRYLLEQLAPAKVPSRIVFVDEIPKGPTGKLKRIGLHEQLADYLHPTYVAPETPFEKVIVEIWEEVLDDVAEPIGRFDNFFALGGDSFRVTRVFARVRNRFGTEVPIERLFETPTVAGLADCLLDILMKADGDE